MLLKKLSVRNHSVFLIRIMLEYKYYPNVLATRKNSAQAKCFSFSEVTTTNVWKLVKRININKARGGDQIPPELIKAAGNFLVYPITDTINSCFNTSTFPDLAKGASVTSIDKGGTDKHAYANCRPVSVLNTFPKIIETSIFDQLIKHANEFLQIFVGTYRKLYISQHILIRLIEEWESQLDKNKRVGAVLLNLSKVLTAYIALS